MMLVVNVQPMAMSYPLPIKEDNAFLINATGTPEMKKAAKAAI